MRRVISILLLAPLVAILTGCSAARTSVSTIRSADAPQFSGTMSYPAALPTVERPSGGDSGVIYPLARTAGYSGPVTIAADPGRGGVWFLSFPATAIGTPAVFYYNSSTGTLDGWTLSATVTPGANQGLAVDSVGDVWVGNGQSLFRLDPTTGTIDTFAVPTPVDSSSEESYRPPELQGVHQINDMAVGPGHQIAITMTAASSVVIFNTVTDSFSQLQAPGRVSVTSVAYLDDGTLGVGLANGDTPTGPDEVWIHPPAGTDTVVSAPSLMVVSAGARFLASSTTAAFITGAGQVTTIAMPGSDSGPDLNAVAIGDWVAAVSSAGIVVLDPSSGSSRTMALGTYPCPTSGAGALASGGASVSNSGTCSVQASALVAGSNGVLWFSGGGDGELLGEATAES